MATCSHEQRAGKQDIRWLRTVKCCGTTSGRRAWGRGDRRRWVGGIDHIGLDICTRDSRKQTLEWLLSGYSCIMAPIEHIRSNNYGCKNSCKVTWTVPWTWTALPELNRENNVLHRTLLTSTHTPSYLSHPAVPVLRSSSALHDRWIASLGRCGDHHGHCCWHTGDTSDQTQGPETAAVDMRRWISLWNVSSVTVTYSEMFTFLG